MASRKLRHYFQSYHIIVPSSQPLKDIIRNREAIGRVGKWGTFGAGAIAVLISPSKIRTCYAAK
jgi:hypothetical protein